MDEFIHLQNPYSPPGDITPSYILHTPAFGTYLLGGGLFTLQKRLLGDGILHVNMFHYIKIPYFTCNVFTKFTYNEYIGPYFLSHVVLRFSPSDLPELFSGLKLQCEDQPTNGKDYIKPTTNIRSAGA